MGGAGCNAVNRMIAAAGYGGRSPEGEVAAYGLKTAGTD